MRMGENCDPIVFLFPLTDGASANIDAATIAFREEIDENVIRVTPWLFLI